MNQNDKTVRQNLIDAGCNEHIIERFFQCPTKKSQLQLLESKREQLLKDYHRDARRLDCLDFLVNQLNKEGEK